MVSAKEESTLLTRRGVDPCDNRDQRTCVGSCRFRQKVGVVLLKGPTLGSQRKERVSVLKPEFSSLVW